MRAALLDSDILNELLKRRNQHVGLHAAAYLAVFGQFTFSGISRYEVRRWLVVKSASRQISQIDQLCAHSQVLPVTNDIFDRATDLWATAQRGGFPCEDADLLIAATALEHNLVLATGNTDHFLWIPNLAVTNWRDA